MSQTPDKIWLHKDTKYSTVEEVFGYQYKFAQEIQDEGIENFIEYVPLDAFIEKAIEYLQDNFLTFNDDDVKEFKEYMEGE